MRVDVIVLLGIVLAGLGCVSAPPVENTTNEPITTEGGILRISLKNVEFTPGNLVMRAGQTVRFENDEGFDHDVAVRAPDGSFIQEKIVLSPGETIDVTLPAAGTYRIECERHLPGMAGTIVVNA